MTNTIDGGPAFPSPQCGDWSPEYGMSLRDWFAGQALAGMMASDDGSTPENVAAEAYEIADAMLAARSLREPRETGEE